jgi:hypothetical protein
MALLSGHVIIPESLNVPPSLVTVMPHNPGSPSEIFFFCLRIVDKKFESSLELKPTPLVEKSYLQHIIDIKKLQCNLFFGSCRFFRVSQSI